MINPTNIQPSNPLNNGTSTAQNTPKPSGQESTQNVANKWVAGEVVKANVVQQLTNGSLMLKIGNATLTAQLNSNQTGAKLPTGTEIQLKVVQTGEQPLLQLVSKTQVNHETSLSALREAIPKQAPLSDFFTNLSQLKAGDQRLPQLVQQAVQTLQAGLTSRLDLLNPEGVKKALAESGSFLEANLSKVQQTSASQTVQGDLKAQLLRLALLLENASQQQRQNIDKNQLQTLLAEHKNLADLQRHVESSLAKVQLNQLNSLHNQEQNTQAFLLDLPVKEKENIDVFSLKLKDEDQNKNTPDHEKRWSIKLAFNLNGLGQMHARLTLGGEQIHASIWAEEESTFNLINSNLTNLKDRLVDVKFIDPDIKCYQGKPETEHDDQSEYAELIDIQI